MTREYEVAAENGHRVRVDVEAEDPDEAQAEAVMKAGEKDPDIWYAGAYLVGAKPVGWDGGDPHDAQAEAEGRDAGDHQ